VGNSEAFIKEILDEINTNFYQEVIRFAELPFIADDAELRMAYNTLYQSSLARDIAKEKIKKYLKGLDAN
jgi:hypothetical protein